MHDTNALARKHTPPSSEAPKPPPSLAEKQDSPSLFCDPTMDQAIDFQSQDGFVQAKGKKKKNNAAQNNWADNGDDDAAKKEEGEGNDGGDKGGDTGAGGDGEKKDEANGDGAGDANGEDEWTSFTTAKSKKKGKKGKAEEPAAELAADKFDAFQEIKLDDTGPMLDLSFDTGITESKSGSGGFGAWASSWNTGTTTNR